MDPKPDEVLVTALTTFRGQLWEGHGGHVKPGDTFSTPRLRAVELKANSLVRDAAANAARFGNPAPKASRTVSVSPLPDKSKEKTR